MRCRAKDYNADWHDCTGKSTGFDAAAIDTCTTGSEGPKVLEKSFADSAAVGIAVDLWTFFVTGCNRCTWGSSAGERGSLRS
jgi:hypothetical protein